MKKIFRKIISRIKTRTWVLLIVIAALVPFVISQVAKLSEATNVPPIAYWAFNEVTDNTCANGTDDACDQTTNANGLARTNATWRTSESCLDNNCAYYDGTGDYFSRADDSDFDYAAADSFSITGWFRSPTSSAIKYIVAKHGTTGSTGGYKVYMDADGDIVCGIDDDDTFDPDASATSTNANYDDNLWHQFTCVKSGTSSLSLYIDGKLIQTNSSISGIGTLANADTLYIGINGDGSTNGWSGFLDEIKVYNYVRTQAEINTDTTTQTTTAGASATFGPNTSIISNKLVGWWKMDETSWTVNCSTESVLDSSGNSNDGAACPNSTGPNGADTGRYGFSNDFDGSNDYVDVDDTDDLDVTASENITISAWVYRDTFTTNDMILSKAAGTSSSNTGYYLTIPSTDEVEFGITDGTDQYVIETAASTITAIGWNHVTVVLNRNSTAESRVYINGTDQTSTRTGTLSSVDSAANSTAVQIGVIGTSTDPYDGRIDEIRMYKRALTPIEVKYLYDWAPAPLGYWKMDERSTSTLRDSSGNSLTLTLNSADAEDIITGKYGSAIDFDGSIENAYLDSDTLNLASRNLTLSAWVYRDTGTTTDNLIVKRQAGVGNTCTASSDAGFQFVIYDSDELAVSLCDGTNGVEYYTAANSVPLNTWTHVAAVVDRNNSNNRKIYVNGISVSITTSGTIPTGSINPPANTEFSIGSYADNPAAPLDPLDGKMDDVRVYDYARTAAQIIEDMNAGHPSVGTPISGNVGHWSLDEATGTTANDKSGNSNSLTLSTASWTLDGKYDRAWNGTGALWMSRADDADFDFIAGDDFTISGWFRSDSTTNPSSAAEYIVSKESSSAGYAIWATTTTAEIVCGIDDDGTSFPEDSAGDVSANPDYYDMNWHHVACVRNTGTGRLELYIDGKLVDSDTSLSATGDLSNTDSLTFGDRNATNDTDDFNGDLDELKIYRAALSPAEILVDMNQGKSVVLGSLSTDSGGTTATTSGARAYCIPGDTTTCSAPVAEWRLDENTGQTVSDTGGSGYNGTLGLNSSSGSDDPSWTTGKIGQGLSFDGTNDYVGLAAINIPANTSAYTISAWIYPSTLSTDLSIYCNSNLVGPCFYIGNTNDDLRLCNDSICSNEASSTASAITANQWQYVSVTYDGTPSTNGSVQFYVNGINVTSDSNTAETSGSAETKTISNVSGSLPFSGKIDQVRIYNYVRTHNQVQWDYNGGAPIGWWKIDDCTGTTVYDNSVTANGTAGGKNGAWTGASGGNTSAGTCSAVDTATAWYNGRNGKYGSSLDFDGTDDVVTVTNTSAIDFNEGLTNGFTWSAWIYANSDGENDGGVFMGKGGSNACSTNSQSGSNLSLTCIWFLTTNDANASVSNAFTTNTWHHVVMAGTNDSDDEISVYVDGKLRATSTDGNGNPNTDTANFTIGQSSAFTNFDGQIDDVRIYQYEVTAAQVRTIYNEGAAVRFGPITGSP